MHDIPKFGRLSSWTLKSKSLLVICLLTISALLALPLLHPQLKSASAVLPGGIGCYSGDNACYFRDSFATDAINAFQQFGGPYSNSVWNTVSWGSSITKDNITGNPAQGLVINLQATGGSGNYARFGIQTINSYSWSASTQLSIAFELAKQTPNPNYDGYLAAVKISPSGGSDNTFIEAGIDANSSSFQSRLFLVEENSGTLTYLWRSQSINYDWVVGALTIGGNGSSSFLEYQVNSYNSNVSNSGQWYPEYKSSNGGFSFTSGYVALIDSSDASVNTQITSRFLSVTNENAEIDASVGMGLAYLARGYEIIPSANNNPMAVMLEEQAPAIGTYDSSNPSSSMTAVEGQPGVTSTDAFYGGARAGSGFTECYTNPCQVLGTRQLAYTTNSESMIYTFSTTYGLGSYYTASANPYLALIVNVSSPNPLTTVYSFEEVYYATGGDTVQVYLGNTVDQALNEANHPVQIFNGNQLGHIVTITDPVGTFGSRYVARHITRLVANLYSEIQYSALPAALNNFMNYYGYGKDFYDCMFGSVTSCGNYPDNYLWSTSTFPDPTTTPNLPTTSTQAGELFYPYHSRLSIAAARNEYVSNFLSEVTLYPRIVPAEDDGLYALLLYQKFGYGTSNSTNTKIIDDLMSAIGWDGRGVRTLEITPGGLAVIYPAYPEYDLGVFLEDCALLSEGNSTYSHWETQALDAALGTQDMYQVESGAGGQSVRQFADEIGGFFGGYAYTPNYEVANINGGVTEFLTSFLIGSGFYSIEPPQTPGAEFASTEPTAIMVTALINANYINANFAGLIANQDAQSNTRTSASTCLNCASTGGSASLAIDDSSGSTSGASLVTSVSTSIDTTKSPEVIVADVVVSASSETVTVSDGASLTWTARTHVSTSNTNTLWEFYAIAPTTLSADSVKASVSTAEKLRIEVFSISGANTASPFDPNSGLPATNSGSGTSASVSVSTSNPKDMILGEFVGNGGPTITAGSGFTIIKNEGNTPFLSAQEELVSSTQSALSVSQTYSASQNWAAIGDAVQAGSSYVTPSSWNASITAGGDMANWMNAASSGTSLISDVFNIPVTTTSDSLTMRAETWLNGTANAGSGSVNVTLYELIDGTSVGSATLYSLTSGSAKIASYFNNTFVDSPLSPGSHTVTFTVNYTASNGASFNFSYPWVNYISFGVQRNTFVPIILTNSQTSATAPNLQAKITINFNQYSSYLDSNVQNIQFQDVAGNPLYAWCQQSCSSSSTSGVVDVKLDQSIPGNGGTLVIYMVFDPTSANDFSSIGYWGEYPTATSTYGQYDNGALVFNYYTNFAGTSLPSSLQNVQYGSGGSVTVNNGITLSSTTSNAEHIFTTSAYSPGWLETYVTSYGSATTNNPSFAIYYTAKPTSTGGDYGFQTDYRFDLENSNILRVVKDVSGTGTSLATSTITPSAPFYDVGFWPYSGNEMQLVNGIQYPATTDSSITYQNSYVGFAVLGTSGSLSIQWMALKTPPPVDSNGSPHYPTASFGSVTVID